MLAAVQPKIVFPPDFDLPTPGTPPSGPVAPPIGGGSEPVLGSPSVNADATQAVGLIKEYMELLGPIRHDTTGTEATKQTRIAAFNLNMDAQKLLEQHFDTADRTTVYALQAAKKMLVDVNWQLAKKPSPDGVFNGVNIPGAIHDSKAAIQQLSLFTQPTDEFPGGAMPVPSPVGGGDGPISAPAPVDPGPQPGDVDYCRTPEFGGGFGR